MLLVHHSQSENFNLIKLCSVIWWNMKGVVCYQMVKPSETVTDKVYRTNIFGENSLRKKIKMGKWAQFILQHINAKLHSVVIVKNLFK